MTAQVNAAGIAQEGTSARSSRGANIALWIIQGLLAALFLFSGSMKFVLPIEAMTKDIHLPGLFLRFIGVCEILGAVGLIVPWLTGIKRVLTPVAASCLVIIMIGATVITLKLGIGQAVTPFVAGILLVGVAYGRFKALKLQG